MFKKIILIGRGKVAASCAEISSQTGIKTEFYTVDDSVQKVSRSIQAVGRGPVQNQIIEKNALRAKIRQETDKVLLISAVNPWLIPADIISMNNLTAVNYHNALLPRHPGRNAECWAIYGQDSVSGITWHYIDPQVDAGNIIIQKEIPIASETTAFSLLREQNEAAIKAFEGFLPDLLEERCSGCPQTGPRQKLHYSWERPNNGVLDLAWSGERISAFLRSFDYGVLKIMGDQTVVLDGTYYTWKKYSISGTAPEQNGVVQLPDELTIQKDGLIIRLRGLSVVEPTA